MRRRNLITGSLALGSITCFGVRNIMADEKRNLFVPAEEAPHELTFMQWPASRKVHRDPVFLEMLQQTIADIANAISDFEPVIMLADRQLHRKARKSLSQNVELWDIPTEDLWCRDSGPLFAFDENGNRVVSHIRFNGWGNKQIHKHDGLVAQRVADRLGFEIVDSGLVGEAGGIEQDGHGLLVAHESSWVNPNRNPGLSRNEIEKRLLAAYGAEKIIWAPGVKGEDITDYHIDSLARFTAAGSILMNLPQNPDASDVFHQQAMNTKAIFEEAGLDISIIPEPNYRRVKSLDFVASYANYYICNGALVMAEFGDRETDQIAYDELSRLYPEHEIIMLNVDPLGEMGGGIHCATQQLPAA